MKKNIIIAAVAATSALLLCASCQKQELIEQNEINPEGKVFTATIENLTKTTITGDYKVNWVTGDKVSINGDEYVATADASDPTKATLAPTEDQPVGKEDGYYYALYPASLCDEDDQGELYFELPDTQTYSAGEFNAPMYAVSTEEAFIFKNICGVLCLSLKGTDKVKSIAVTANEAICGTFEMTDATTVNLTGEGKKVTLDCGAEGVQLNETTATNFYIYLPPKDSYSAGMKIVVTSTDGKTFEKTTTTAVKIEKNNIYTFDWTAVFGSDGPECDVEVKFYYVSELLPDQLSQFPDHSALAYTISSQSKDVTSVKVAMGKKSTIDKYLDMGYTLERLASEMSTEPQSCLSELSTKGAFSSIFAPLDPSAEYEIIVLASNSYGKSALVYDIKSTAAIPSYSGELVIGDYTITDEISLDGGTSEQTFTVISKDGTDSNISIKNLANDDNFEWYATYDKNAHTLTLDGTAYGYESYESIFLYSLYSMGSYSAGYLAGNTGSEPIVFSVDPTTHQISSLETDYALCATDGNSIIGYFKYFAAGVATIVKGEQ